MLADARVVSPGYFAAVGIPLLAGEACKRAETFNTVVVNRSFARAYLGGNSPVGRHLQSAAGHSSDHANTILGVVADAREQGAAHRPVPTVYWCASAPMPTPYFLLRVHGQPMAMAETLRQAIAKIEPGRSVYGVTTLQEHLDDTQEENRLRTALLTLFAATAITLACVGLYGVLSYVGSTRQRELALRLALGASRWQVARRLLDRALLAAAAGSGLGVLVGWIAGHLVAGTLYGVSVHDPATYACTTLLMAAVTVLATAAPALRAARLNPVEALREQ